MRPGTQGSESYRIGREPGLRGEGVLRRASEHVVSCDQPYTEDKGKDCRLQVTAHGVFPYLQRRIKMSPSRNRAALEAGRFYDKNELMPKKILVVDDDAELIELISFNLKQAGYAVETAVDGAAAIKKARSMAPDLIVLDVMMPELDGFAVCEILRRDAATASIPILMLTAISSELGRMAGLGSGASDFVTKPFSPRLLAGRIEDLLKKAHSAAS